MVMLTIKGDISRGLSFHVVPYKTCLLSELFEAALELKGSNIMDITS